MMQNLDNFIGSNEPHLKPPSEKNSARYETRYFLAFGWGLVFALSAIALIMVLRAKQAEGFPEVKLNEQLMDRFSNMKKTADLSIVMLGNSRLRHAVNFGFNPEDLVELNDGRRLTSLMFARNVAHFNLYSQIAPNILSIEPDILVVQDTMLTQAAADAAWYVASSLAAFNYLNSLFMKQKLEDIWLNARMDISEHCFEDFTIGPVERTINLNRVQPLHSLSAENPNRAASLAFINEALEKGITVIIISLPADRELGQLIGNSPHVMDFNGIGHYPTREELLPGSHGEVFWLAYESDAGSRHFCDFIHLNQRGRGYFTARLLDSLQRLPIASIQ